MGDKIPSACQICGEQAKIGFYYNVTTCPACKKFFERTSSKTELGVVCVNEKVSKTDATKTTLNAGNCVITKTSRSNCIYCRFKKCIRIGMNIDANKEKIVTDFKLLKCKVCNSESTGIHYGVVTCEGCKGFFRRILEYKERTCGDLTEKFTCHADGKCEVTHPARSSCQSCRYDKCVRVGMAQTNVVLGRRTNMTKQQLSVSNTVTQSPESQATLPSAVVQNWQISPAMPSLTTISQTLSTVENMSNSVLDTLPEACQILIKSIVSSYTFIEKIKTDLVNSMVPDYLIPLEEILIHAQSCIKFLQSLSVFERFSENDQCNIIINSIHLIRLVQIIRHSDYLNYFNYDPSLFEKVIRYFPIFENIQYFNSICKQIREMNLDRTEFAIYTTYLVFSSSYTPKFDAKVWNEVSLELCRALHKYMFARRGEVEASEILVDISLKMEKTNLLLQRGIYENLVKLKLKGFVVDKIYENYLISEFVLKGFNNN